MSRYKDATRNSGILSYSLGDDYIKIVFKTGSTYLYTNKSTGKRHIEQMKKLAVKGKGLATYINIHVRDRFEEKL
ncbi:MAG: hypothetical protein K0S53_1960 [Bacteroidetes bacterium]|jgi:hypothetical protein|nr:hypothetical protein [Bacteroidota bacterium]MDF2451026.1 hypothetical protein [Bacteroidota bacterium]